jgi:hypothetical protein
MDRLNLLLDAATGLSSYPPFLTAQSIVDLNPTNPLKKIKTMAPIAQLIFIAENDYAPHLSDRLLATMPNNGNKSSSSTPYIQRVFTTNDTYLQFPKMFLYAANSYDRCFLIEFFKNQINRNFRYMQHFDKSPFSMDENAAEFDIDLTHKEQVINWICLNWNIFPDSVFRLDDIKVFVQVNSSVEVDLTYKNSSTFIYDYETSNKLTDALHDSSNDFISYHSIDQFYGILNNDYGNLNKATRNPEITIEGKIRFYFDRKGLIKKMINICTKTLMF